MRAGRHNQSMEALDPSKLAEGGVWFIVFLFSLTVHEAGHALLARLGGDDTAYLGGQVTLNPLPHIRREPFGMILVPLLSFFMAGWMMGWASTPFDPFWAGRHPRRQAVMSAAGPVANLLLAAIAFAALASLLAGGVLVAPARLDFSHMAAPAPGVPSDSLLHPAAMALSITLNLNLLLFVFNLFPLPPLDGSGIVQGLFPDSIGRLIGNLQRQPMFGLIGLVIVWQMLGYVFRPLFALVVLMLHGDVYGAG